MRGGRICCLCFKLQVRFFECSIIHACFFFIFLCLRIQTLTHYTLFEFFWFFFLGTTGDPKPILYLHQFLEIFLENRLANELLLNNNTSSSPPSQQLLCFAHLNQDIYFPCMFPISWSAALTSCTLSSLAWDVTCIYLPPDAPFDSHPMLTPEYVHDILELTPKGPKNGIIMAPAMLRDVVQQHQQQQQQTSSSCTSSSLHLLQNSYNWIGYGGSPLDFATGEILRKSFSSSSSPIRLQCAMGQTDVGPYDILFNPNPADWNLVQFSELHGYFLVEFDQREGLWELCVRRQQKQKGEKGKEGGKEECRHPFLMDEKLDVYHTRDLFRAVRRKKGGGEGEGEKEGEEGETFWQSAGRVDDFIKLSTLTKFHSGQIESILERWCEEVQTCLVGGEGKIRPWVIVELRQTKKKEEMENGNGMTKTTPPPESFWLAVDKANEILYSEAKIQREFVVFTDAERPIQRTGKGSVDRKKTVGLYEREIEALYE